MTGSNCVVDISHFNGSPDLQKAKAAGILGVIQKATQGTTYSDPTFTTNRQKAADAGLFFGSYHFGIGGDPQGQADHYLSVAQPLANEIVVLDFETNTQGQSMSLEEAREFVTRIEAAVGRWPGLYGGSYLKEQLGNSTDPVLTSCWLWLSQYASTPVIPAAWPAWTLWQYTNGKSGPQPWTVDGIGACDRDTFNGSVAELTTFWQAGGILQAAAIT
jgi:lysozyme